MLRSIIPRDELFFDLFDSLTTHIVDGARILREMMESGDDLDAFAERLLDCEHRADEAVHTALARLHRTFITPLDRLDIHRLVVSLDDILDLANAAGSRLALYRPRTRRPEAAQLAATLVAATEVVQEMIGLLRNMKQRVRILELTVAVNSRENEADRQRRAAIASLLEQEKDPFEFMKWKEILDFIEEATDRCELVADIVEGIVLAHG
jgi:uncharacterized protein Yka (UPF0111/DUF47 family)